MRDDEHARTLAAVMQTDRVEHAAQPEDHVAPALTAGRAGIEVPDARSQYGLIGKALLDAGLREAVQHSELLLPGAARRSASASPYRWRPHSTSASRSHARAGRWMTSRSAMSMMGSPAAWAASRATLPAL